MQALIVLRALNRKWGWSCARRLLQSGLDQPPLELGGLHRHLVGLPLALLHLRGVVASDRHAGNHRINQEVPVEPFEEELPDAVGRP